MRLVDITGFITCFSAVTWISAQIVAQYLVAPKIEKKSGKKLKLIKQLPFMRGAAASCYVVNRWFMIKFCKNPSSKLCRAMSESLAYTSLENDDYALENLTRFDIFICFYGFISWIATMLAGMILYYIKG